jgi:ABC-2 type transport system ATP-binding protein
MAALEINAVSKRYGLVSALKRVRMSVSEGELFGIIGPDGAGKTTLIRAICTLIFIDEGTIQVMGMDVKQSVFQIRALLGYMPQRFSLYQDLTVEQNLQFFAGLYQVEAEALRDRIHQLYRFSRLEPFRNRRVAALSGGMKQKLALSCALIHTPKILILDEPTFGVDPVSREEFWEILRAIRQEGTTILVSTAYMEEAEQCDRVALFFRGEIVGLDAPEQLKKAYRFPLFRLEGKDLRILQTFFQSLDEVHNTQLFGDSLHVSCYGNPKVGSWQKWKKTTGGNLLKWKLNPPSMEDVFLDLMGASK